MHKKLKKSPLTYVIAQVRFSEMLDIEDYIKEIQKAVRDEFSEFKVQNITAIDFIKEKVDRANIWQFIDKTFTSGIILTTNSIAIHTSKYLSFEDMIGKTRDVLVKVNKILHNNLYSRLGLRYINLIHESVKTTVKPGLLGHPIFKGVYLTTAETRQNTKNGTINVKSIRASDTNINNLLYIPPDLRQCADFLSFEHHKDKKLKREYLILDIDHFTNVPGEFTDKNILWQFKKLHEAIFVAFRSSIKDCAWKKWE